MFSKTPRAGGARPSPGVRAGDGPTPIRGEKLQLRSFERKEDDSTPVGTSSAHDAEATHSLLFLSSQANGGVAENTKDGGSSGTALAASGALSGQQSQPTNGATGAAGGNSGATTSSASTGQNGVIAQQESPSADVWFGGQTLEYAAGVALRTNVLRPVLEKGLEEELSFAMRTKVPRLLGSYSSGKAILFKGTKGEIHEASIQRITHQDAPLLVSWFKDDKVLSYTSPDWSDWWVRRCHCLDPGCEMFKMVEKNGDVLGVVYYERNIVDCHLMENRQRTRTTLVRGIRLAPFINPEVIKRSGLSDSETTPEVPYKGIASLLFCHVLFMSIRYGSQCVGLYCPKSEVAESFYESFTGKAIARNEEDGRRYYRMDSTSRWTTLQQALSRQISLRIQREGEDQSTSTAVEKEESPTETNSSVENDGSADVELASDKDSQDMDGEAERETKRRRREEHSKENGGKAENGNKEDSEDEMESV